MTNLWGLTLADLTSLVTDGGFPKFRAKQIHDYLYKRYVYDFDAMKQLPAPLREWLKTHASIEKPEIMKEETSFDGNTTKILLKLSDGSLVETVCMHHDYGNSICVSSQVGCAMGCIFCASTRNGLERNLTAGEILAQVYAFRERCDTPVHSIVMMGSGEPLQNYDNALQFIRLCHSAEFLNLSYRNITISTCGIVPEIYRLAEEKLPVTLAISLHAPNDRIRNQILPASRTYPMQTLMDVAVYYYKTTGRRITFEYILIDGINAGNTEAEELAALTKNLPCHFNLIPINGTEHIKLYPPSNNQIFRFKGILEKNGKETTVRRQMGDEIQAACGQLKRRYLDKKENRR